MIKAFITVAGFLLGGLAHADGFICESYAANLRIKVYDQIDMSVPAAMIVSDPSRTDHRTIASFKQESCLLSQSGSTYSAKVDLRYSGSRESDQIITGVALGEVDQIVLQVDYNVTMPLTDGAELPGKMTVTLRSGAAPIELEALCERYIKDEVKRN
jgi:hypothetical protein